MHLLITVALAIALVAVVVVHLQQRRAVQRLQHSLRSRKPLLREESPSAASSAWEELREEANDLIAETNRIKEQRSGELAQLEATLGSLQEGVLIVDATNHILLANSALQAIFPRATNVLGQRVEAVLQSAAFLRYVELVRRNEASPQHEVEFTDGLRSTWIEVTGTTIPSLADEKDRWALFVLHDVTKQKKLEAVRKDFVANVSHELRTPLSIIKGYVETLVDDHEHMPKEDRSRFLTTIQRHTERLNSLLEDLLTLSRLESVNPGLRRESTDLARLVQTVVDDHRARPAAAEHTIVASCGPGVSLLLVDPLKITQVLENLLENALKYTPKGSRIEVTAAGRGDSVEICVRDNGPGIPAVDLPHIFERFYRVEKGRSREKGGTGLGLSIVKHIVQLHGGRVWAESQPGQGSAFFFTLPARAPVAEPIAR